MAGLETGVTNKSLLTVLVSDSSQYRSPIVLKGGGCFVRHSYSLRDTIENLDTRSWDIVFSSGYHGDWHNWLELVEPLAKAYEAKRIRLVIHFNPILKEGREFCQKLSEKGVPVRYIPWDYKNPSVHKEVNWRD